MLKRLLINERFILIVILLNSLVIFIEGFDIDNQRINFSLELLDQIFTVVFLLELVVKLKTLGTENYFASNWNVFDFILIALALPSLFSLFFEHFIFNLNFLLIFRTMRIFKFFRFIRFIPKVDKLISGVYRASKASIIIIFAFFIFNFIVSLLSCFLFKTISPEHFGNPLISLYSIFKIFTVEGWFDIPEAISDSLSLTESFFVKIYFIIILFFGGIFGLSIVNSIFVDSMISDNNEDLEKKVDSLEKKIDILISKSKEQ
jgi:voltage-gated sodium channel